MGVMHFLKKIVGSEFVNKETKANVIDEDSRQLFEHINRLNELRGSDNEEITNQIKMINPLMAEELGHA